MRVAIATTEAQMNELWSTNPLVVPDLLNTIWYNNIKVALATQFGSSASASYSCTGVPFQPAYWSC